jgi:probable F420-dependent oxidoreductase
VQFGVIIFPTDYSIGIAELARAAENLGFESLWVTEHTHIPADRRTPWPGGAELPRHYWHTLDPFIALSTAAAVTTQLRLGIGVCLVIERDPITLAKEVASLDLVSNGRFLFGVGGGWNLEEMANHGTDPSRRWALLRERILAMKAIWTQEEAEYHGQLVNFDRIWQWPKPVQQPHPPIVVGGNGPHTLRRVIEYGDEWMPIYGRGGPAIEERTLELRRMAQEAGRGDIPVSSFGAQPDPRVVERLEAAGVSRCLFMLPSAGADEVLPLLDRYAQLGRAFV